MAGPAIAIHGGCGVMPRSGLSETDWKAARQDLATALRAGWHILEAGGAALNAAGEHELDASIMRGADLAAGAVTLARHVRNPIRAARALLQASGPVMLGGTAADVFAKEAGLEMVDQAYFTTERCLEALASLKQRAQEGTNRSASEAEKHGAVSAVALDLNGRLAAATPTSGYNNKPIGRIGDSPIIDADTYARDGGCAVSGTGAGEFFIRHAAGNVTAPFNTEGMFRGWITPDGHLCLDTHTDILSTPL